MSVLSAVQTRFKPGRSSYLVLWVKSLLLDLSSRGVKVKLVWIPGHSGVRGNEWADSLAKDAVRCGRPSQVGVPLSEIKNLWKADLRTELLSWCRSEAPTRGAYYCENFLTNPGVPGLSRLLYLARRLHLSTAFAAATPRYVPVFSALI